MNKIDRIIKAMLDADAVEILEFDFDECVTMIKDMEEVLTDVLTAHEQSTVDWPAMRKAKALLSAQ